MLSALNQSSSHVGAARVDDVTPMIVSSSRLAGCAVGAALSVLLGRRLAVPLVVYMVTVFSTCLGMPSSGDGTVKLVVCHGFQSLGLGLIQTSKPLDYMIC